MAVVIAVGLHAATGQREVLCVQANMRIGPVGLAVADRSYSNIQSLTHAADPAHADGFQPQRFGQVGHPWHSQLELAESDGRLAPQSHFGTVGGIPPIVRYVPLLGPLTLSLPSPGTSRERTGHIGVVP